MKKLFYTTATKFVCFFLLSAFFLMGCKKEPNNPIAEAPILTQHVNAFIKAGMEDVYLWKSNLPTIDTKYEFDSKAYFHKLLYEEDKWSFITDDIQGLEASFNGVETSFGYSLTFGRFSNTGNLFAIIEYVYPNSPASNAGLKRGDIIVLLDGADITVNNYNKLFNGTSLTITMGTLNNGSIVLGNTIPLTSQILNLDPVLIANTIEEGGHKIGYLFYAQFISNYNSSLDAAFQDFKSQGITDMVLDLRYNPGGYMSAAQYLCSSLAPTTVVNAEDVLVTMQWNGYYQSLWETNPKYDYQIHLNFKSTNPVKLDLSKIYILTGSGSASASELTITGLDPYMEVVLIGDTTYGKYTGSITLKPEDIYQDSTSYADFDNWGIQPIVLRYANANGVTDFKNGFAPDFYVYDNLFDGFPLGDPTEPLLAKALEQITGITKISSFKKIPSFEYIDRGFSRFDRQKQNLIVDLKKEFLKK